MTRKLAPPRDLVWREMIFPFPEYSHHQKSIILMPKSYAPPPSTPLPPPPYPPSCPFMSPELEKKVLKSPFAPKNHPD